MDSQTEVLFATIHLEGEADFWFQTLQADYPVMIWKFFVEQVLLCFSSGSQENLFSKFNKLTQSTTFKAYMAEFEELRGYMMARHSFQTEEFYLSSILSGLRPDIQQALYVFHLSPSYKALDKAK